MVDHEGTPTTRPGAYEIRSKHLAEYFAHPPKNSPAHVAWCKASKLQVQLNRWARLRQAIKNSVRGMEVQ